MSSDKERNLGELLSDAVAAEVEKLRAENAALREIAQAVATMKARSGNGRCDHCGESRIMEVNTRTYTSHVSDDYDHTPGCPVTRARALLEGARG